MDMYNGQQPYGWFSNPNLPPANGGKLMNAREILAHEERVKNPPKISDLIQTVKMSMPIQQVSPIAVGFGGEHAIYTNLLGGPLPLKNGQDSLGVQYAPHGNLVPGPIS
jgi:hypothetical protein